MIEASATRSPAIPWTRSRGSTTASTSRPIRQVPTGCRLETPRTRISSIICSRSALRAGQHLLGDERLQRRLRRDLAAQSRAVDQRLEIVIAGEKIELDRRRRQRVGALDPHPTAALGAQMHRAEREGRKRVRLDPGPQPLDGAPARHVDLDIRLFQSRVAAHQRAGVDPGVRQMAGAAEHVLHRRLELQRRAHRHVVDRDLLRAAPHQVGVEVVVQIFARPPPCRGLPGYRIRRTVDRPSPDSCNNCGEP